MTERKINLSEELQVFVYGTLKPGEINYKRYCVGKVVAAQKAFVCGQLFALPVGYPAMILGESLVKGYLLSFADSSVLTLLDNLEGYLPNRHQSENLYNRISIEVYQQDSQLLGQAWVYVMSPERVYQMGGVPQVDGWWTGRF
ncbi:MAG TPA: gamma-glutamylcyclotransferase [Nostocaceae cyanobacterium]|nr:gamma-glutamylcyclotransferase [Nostocaceae cyanobacterium]